MKIAGAKKGLVHVSQNIPTKSSLSVSLVRPEDVIIQVIIVILIIIIIILTIIIIIKVFIFESTQVAAVGPKESSMSFNLVLNCVNRNIKMSFALI